MAHRSAQPPLLDALAAWVAFHGGAPIVWRALEDCYRHHGFRDTAAFCARIAAALEGAPSSALRTEATA